jgi:hypothetical protein
MAVAMAMVVFAVLAMGGRFAPAAHAQSSEPQPTPPGQFKESWGLAPTSNDPTGANNRAFYAYTLDPGATQDDSATLWNFGDVGLTFHVYATDAFDNRTGDFTLLPGDHAPTDVGSWVKLQTGYIDVPAHTKVDIPFTVTVPKGASPGDHAAGIVASVPTPTAGPNGARITIDRRTGSRLYVRVGGKVNPSLSVENLSSNYSGAFNPLDGSLDVSYTIHNSGNVRVGAHQEITVHDLFGREVASRKMRDLPDVLPGNSFTIHQRFTGIPATLRVGADVKVTPYAALGTDSKGQLPAVTTSTTHAWAIPWTVLLLVALAVLLWRLYRRWKQPRSDLPPAQSGATGSRPSGGPATGAGSDPPRVRDPVARSGTPPGPPLTT